MVERDLLPVIANRLRKQVIQMTTEAGSGHPTSCMSCAEIFAVLFFHEMNWDPNDPDSRSYDQFILSKGHAAPILYAALKEAGALKNTDLLSLRKNGSILEGHPSVRCPFIKIATGSLGQGLSAACGIALARKNDNIKSTVFVLLGDGETQEGSVWESLNFASHYKLNNLIAIVDINRLGQSGPTMFEHEISNYEKRFQAFGWNTISVDGHNTEKLIEAVKSAKQKAPCAILAKTIKGKGVPFLEDTKGDHGRAVPKEKLQEALASISNHAFAVEVKPLVKAANQNNEGLISADIDLPYKPGDMVATREAYGATLKEIGKKVKNLYVLDADVKNSTYSEKFLSEFPERFVQAFIAEQNMAGMALGLAVEGKIPTFSSFACFLTRAFDFFRMAAYSRPAHYIVCGSHAGASIGEDGPSQMGLEDIAMMKSIFESTVVYPSDAVSAAKLTCELIKQKGVSYIRTTRPKTKVLYEKNETFPVGGSKTLRSSTSDKATIIACGVTLYETLKAYDLLKSQGTNIRVIDLYSIKPIDQQTIRKAIDETKFIITCEDHSVFGGIGDEVAKVILSYGKQCRFRMLGVQNIPSSGSPEELLSIHGIDCQAIIKSITQSA
ncbi:MAG: transketolase [Planctomycetes bacterium]|nr:transketolase [Planctomycetota bacterium]